MGLSVSLFASSGGCTAFSGAAPRSSKNRLLREGAIWAQCSWARGRRAGGRCSVPVLGKFIDIRTCFTDPSRSLCTAQAMLPAPEIRELISALPEAAPMLAKFRCFSTFPPVKFSIASIATDLLGLLTKGPCHGLLSKCADHAEGHDVEEKSQCGLCS